MNIGKAIQNYAARRGISFEVWDDKFLIWDIQNDNEWMCSYSIDENTGFLHFYGNVYLPQEVKEELPATIDTEKKLKEVINFISKEFVSREY
ncbi:hypothetical protein DX255_00235 [Salmonella enterica]|nr:hypothetical protein [Salmonella enterica]EDO3795975.1 hypothetical protein [Salmonella enterica subsp. enterica serovar Enteritidis]EBS8098571.1 hypothetical protein [Salmonella enterica]ECW2286598.1 hypothetical protein [Salmonella enterica]EGW2416063.1 hypothetical protein [Salmonella enterica]